MRLIEAQSPFHWSMLNKKSQSRSQSLLPLPDLPGKIEGDSAPRVSVSMQGKWNYRKLIYKNTVYTGNSMY